jgi:hypothetical protein
MQSIGDGEKSALNLAQTAGLFPRSLVLISCNTSSMIPIAFLPFRCLAGMANNSAMDFLCQWKSCMKFGLQCFFSCGKFWQPNPKEVKANED